MAEHRSKRGKADRAKFSGGEGYDVYYFARKHNLSPDKARKLIDQIGNDREKLNKAAAKLVKR